MSVRAGLDELAEATAWQRANGNTSRPCQDCGVHAIGMWVAHVTIAKRTVERRLCLRCRLRQMAEG